MMDLSQLRKMISGKFWDGELMSKHTSYGVGGPALAYIEPKSVRDIQQINIFAETNSIPVYFVGSGSNLLVSDRGIDGLVVSIEKSFKKLLFENDTCYAEAGIKLSKLVKESIKRNLGGLETLIGIPGTLGGAIKMNAGAFGNDISNYLSVVEILNKDGEVEHKNIEDIQFNYRHSNIGSDELILSAEFRLLEKTESEIQENRARADKLRKTTQPLKYRSAGSVFKNPKGYAAGYLIDQVGLKGKRIGESHDI